jgi:cellulose synthase operon protein YhjQ
VKPTLHYRPLSDKRDDVAGLRTAIASPDYPYQALRQTHEAWVARQHWPLLGAATQTPSLKLDAQREETLPTRTILALCSTQAGSGSSTLGAALAEAWCRQGHSVLAVDLNPANTLRLAFTVPYEDPDGWARRCISNPHGHDWHLAAWKSNSGVHVMPFGQTSADGRTHLAAHLALTPGWLQRWLSSLALPNNCRILLVAGAQEAPFASEAMTQATHVLHLTTPLALFSRATLPSPRHTWLMNRFDARRPFDHDALALARSILQQSLCPIVIHEDTAIQEALAQLATVIDTAPASQSAQDILRLAVWLAVRLRAQSDDATHDTLPSPVVLDLT